MLDRVVKGADGYPPYNIERCERTEGQPEKLRITLAVAGFTRDQLDVTIEENQLVIRGRQQDDKARNYIHRGIAARHFQRTFVLADGMQVMGADLRNGLLSIDLTRPSSSSYIWINVDGAGGPAVAGAPLGWFDALYPGAGPDHGFDVVVPASPGVHQVCVYGTAHLLGCRRIATG